MVLFGTLMIVLTVTMMAAIAVKATSSVRQWKLKSGDLFQASKSFGYKQELVRDMGGFSNFAVSFSIISILTGAVSYYGYGFSMVAPR